MTEKERLLLEMNQLNDLLDLKAIRNDYAVFLKIKNIINLLIYRIEDLEKQHTK